MRKLNHEKALVIFSGGQDSTTCLAWTIEMLGKSNVEALTFNYGQRHSLELKQSEHLANAFGVVRTVIDLNVFENFNDSALIDHRKDISKEEDGLPISFVPGRNTMFLLTAAMLAYKLRIGNIVAGVCQTDFSGYPDCRQQTIDAIKMAINMSMETDFKILTPLMDMSKADTFGLANRLGILDVVLTETATCYNGNQTRHLWGMGCGQCPACKIREKGFNDYIEKIS